MSVRLELTAFKKSGGPLTKRIYLDGDKAVSDASACLMSRGTGRRIVLDNVHDLAELIGCLAPHEAIALGALRPDLPDIVEIATKAELGKLNGAAPPRVIARTGDYIAYRDGRPALVLLDYDTKAMPAAVSAKLDEMGSFWPALVSIIPALRAVAHVMRCSTSAGLYRVDTGTPLSGSNGLHVYLVVRDGADAERFLKTLHARCWLAGLG